MSENAHQRLRVLVANERRERLALLAEVVGALGHEVVAGEVEVSDVSAVTARERPDVALVGVGESQQHALELIERIVHESSCPVIALLWAEDAAFIRDAATRGVFGYIVDTVPDELQSAIDIALQRFSDYQDLKGALGRRAAIEQAKGILMARHAIGADEAFGMLRVQSNHTGQKLAHLAAAVVDSHLLSLPPPAGSALDRGAEAEPEPETLGHEP